MFIKSPLISREPTAGLVGGLEKTSSTSMGIGVVGAESVCFILALLSTVESLAMNGEERREDCSDAAETGEKMCGEGASAAKSRAMVEAWMFFGVSALGVSMELSRVEGVAAKPMRNGGVIRELYDGLDSGVMHCFEPWLFVGVSSIDLFWAVSL